MKIELKTIRSGYDRESCWVHARCGVIPPGKAGGAGGGDAVGLITMQKLSLSGTDVFHEICDMRSDDAGKTWSDPVAHSQTLGRRRIDEHDDEALSDFTPTWHHKQGVLLGTGHTVRYRDGHVQPHPRPREVGYSIYNPQRRSWSARQALQLPDEPMFFSAGAGSTQRVDLPNGEILLPIYYAKPHESAEITGPTNNAATVVRCGFDGEHLHYIEHGNSLSVPQSRGLGEPSIVHADGRYFLTLRNDDAGYMATSDDGLHFSPPQVWRFDDGTELGNYNTQQHWLKLAGKLYLVYTRKGANNDHVFRHRAPLFIAEVDTTNVRVIRGTEQIVVPERGARLGNFGIAQVRENEAWLVVSEWMQTTLPNPFDCRVCEQYGSDNSIYLAKLRA